MFWKWKEISFVNCKIDIMIMCKRFEGFAWKFTASAKAGLFCVLFIFLAAVSGDVLDSRGRERECRLKRERE